MAYDPADIAEVLSEHLWLNRLHKIPNKPFMFYPFESVGINHVADLFIDQHPIPWISVKSKCNLVEKLHFRWFQLMKVISDKWANIMKAGTGSTQDLNNEKFSVMINRSHASITQLTSKCIYMHIVNKIATVPTAQRWFEQSLKLEQNQDSYDFDWNKIYMLSRKSTTDSRTRVFQCRLLNNVLYLNNQLFKMKLVETPLSSLCNNFAESAIHYFSECRSTQTLWNKVQHWLHPNIELLPLNPQNAMLGFFEAPNSSDLNIAKHILLIFKQAVYNKRNCSIFPNIDYIKQKIRLAYQIEKK